MQQLSLFELSSYENALQEPEFRPDLDSYDSILVAFSGGKDSLASFLTLLEMGADPAKIELHHHLVDGREGSTLFDWAVTEDYCRQFAKAFDIRIFYSWIEGGLEREMCRLNQPKAPTHFETPKGECVVGGKGQPGTRQKFPAKTADLRTRWCSAYAKIDVLDISINNQERFNNSRTLVVTGERAEESTARANYPTFIAHRTDRRDSPKLKRHIDHWRPVHHLRRKQIWAKLQHWLINPHPCYFLGWGRMSCQQCIFGSTHQWASNYLISPQETQKMHEYELRFGHTLDNKMSIPEMAFLGKPYASINSEYIQLAKSECFSAPILLTADTWRLPVGAYGEDAGPS